ncbi:ABC transporter ATP-binding protein [Pigmentiphaga kullae]|uniref:Lipopolysaccharide transport system ATP-binding protein n=1 Tax=Pigmentiphaga kullae TaxID=151784 RepID=A0A4V2F2C4_9BURK|nr:ABC transporter ATP-binding protein [Pigmentiphaga kullae]RZS77042.1 lipopolysaccharide transport system ATP-binding protein [Pigmentiphaga kullae]
MHINLKNVSIRFPIYDAKQRSFKQTVLNVATGGRIIASGHGLAQVEALKDIDLDIREGDRIALLGHNGSGKTTLLRVLAGVYAPVSGSISVQGRVTSLLDSMLGMDGEATGYENIKLRSLFLGIRPSAVSRLVDDIAEFSELGDFLNIPVRTYSSGMVLRLAFAISTSVQPEILLMDEWMSVGDERFRQKAAERLDGFVKGAGILVIATHDMDLAHRVCDKVIHLEHGRIVNVTMPAAA